MIKPHAKAIVVLIILFAFSGIAQSQATTIAVAANLKEAFASIIAANKTLKLDEIKIIYGSSGNFTTQILNGAPFNLFISADEQYPLELYKLGKTVDQGKIYAQGKIVLITNKSSGLALMPNKEGLIEAIAKANKIALAKPELAPYGRAAIQYLKAMGVWELAKPKLVFADNVALASMYVKTGAADLGITALSLAQSPALTKETQYLVINDKLYEPIKQRMVLMKNSTPLAKEIYQYLQSAQAQELFIKFGYTAP